MGDWLVLKLKYGRILKRGSRCRNNEGFRYKVQCRCGSLVLTLVSTSERPGVGLLSAGLK